MSSASSTVSDALAGYIAGRVPGERVVAMVAAAYYGVGAEGLGPRERLRPLMEVIERAHPGVIELSGTAERPGFAVRLAERPFPKRHEAEFRQAVQALLVGGYLDSPSPHPQPLAPRPGVFTRLVRAVRRLFTAST